MRRLIAVIVMLLCLPVASQDDETPPPTDLFSPYVEVIERDRPGDPPSTAGCDPIGDFTQGFASDGWVLFQDPNTAAFHLCDTVNGVRSVALPADVIWGSLGQFNFGITPNPAGDKALIFAENVDTTITDAAIIAHMYDVNADTLTEIGRFPRHDAIRADQWTETAVVLSASTRSQSTGTVDLFYYVASLDGGQPAALIEQFPLPPDFNVTYSDTEPFTVTINKPCVDVIYLIEARQRWNIDGTGVCVPDYGNPAGRAYYRVLNDNATTADVVRFDATTNTRAIVYTGEVEDVLWVSANGTLAVLMLGNSGLVEDRPELLDHRPLGSLQRDAVLALVDLQTDTVLYRISVIEGASSTQLLNVQTDIDLFGLESLWRIIPVTDGQFIVTPNFENQAIPIDIGDAPTRLLTRNADGSVRATPIATDVIPTQYTFNGVFFTEAYTNGHIALKYYDVHTLTAYPITNPDLAPLDAPRRVEIRHVSAPDVIRVRFIYSGDLSAQYRIRLNLPNTQQPSAPATTEPDTDTTLTEQVELRVGQAVAVRVERDLVLNLRTDPSENAEILTQLTAG